MKLIQILKIRTKLKSKLNLQIKFIPIKNSKEILVKLKKCQKILDPYAKESKESKFGLIWKIKKEPLIN